MDGRTDSWNSDLDLLVFRDVLLAPSHLSWSWHGFIPFLCVKGSSHFSLESILSISINWSVTTHYYLIFEVINCQREHISKINFDIVRYTAYVCNSKGAGYAAAPPQLAGQPAPRLASLFFRGRKPLFGARNRILWLATLSRMTSPSSKMLRTLLVHHQSPPSPLHSDPNHKK